MAATSKRPLCLATGLSGFLGARLVPPLSERFELVCASRTRPAGIGFRFMPVDLSEPAGLESSGLDSLSPEIVIHAAVAGAPAIVSEPLKARAVNDTAVEWLASRFTRCRRFIFCSTDLVFDGESAPYSEADEPMPISEYGRAKRRGEELVRDFQGERALIVRLALLYGWRPKNRESFLAAFLERATAGTSTPLFIDEWRSPLYVVDAAQQLAELSVKDEVPPIVHLAGPDAYSRYAMGVRALEAFGLDRSLAVPVSQASRPELGARPRDVSLDARRAAELGLCSRSLADGLQSMRAAVDGPQMP